MEIAPIVCGLMVLLGIVCAVMSRVVWRWYNITLLVLIVLAAPALFILSARTLSTEANWHKEVKAYQERVAEIAGEHKKLVEGVQPDGTVTPENLAKVNADLRTAMYGRGRVWPKDAAKENQLLRAGATPGGTLSVRMNGVEAHIEPNTTLFVFETKYDKDGKPYLDKFDGGQYLGEFQVTKSDATSVEMTSVVTLSEPEILRISKSSGPWTLYEIMPADSHEVFAAYKDPAKMQEWMPKSLGLDSAPYLTDGDKVDDKTPDSPEIWTRVKFTKDHELDDPISVKTDPKAAAKLTFKAGAEATFDSQTAAELVQAGVAEKVGRVRMRRLRDYAQIFRDHSRQLLKMTMAADKLDADRATTAESTKHSQDAQAVCDAEKAKLAADLVKYREESAIVGQVLQEIEAKTASTQAAARKTFAENNQLAAELVQLQRQVAAAAVAAPAAPTQPQASNK